MPSDWNRTSVVPIFVTGPREFALNFKLDSDERGLENAGKDNYKADRL